MANITETIQEVSNIISSTNLPKPPEIPVAITSCAAGLRCGISAKRVTAKIISQLGNIGIDSSKMPSGEDNKLCRLIALMVEEIYNDILMNGFVDGGAEAGSMTITGTAVNAGGAAPVTATNVLPTIIKAIIR